MHLLMGVNLRRRHAAGAGDRRRGPCTAAWPCKPRDAHQRVHAHRAAAGVLRTAKWCGGLCDASGQASSECTRCLAQRCRESGPLTRFFSVRCDPVRHSGSVAKHELAHSIQYVASLTSDVSRGYLGHATTSAAHDLGGASFQSANSTLENVKSTYNQWGRTASVPNGALRGHGTMMPPPPPSNMMSRWSSDTESTNWSYSSTMPTLSLKRSMGEDESDAILAGAFADGDGSFGASWDMPMVPEGDSSTLTDAPALPESRPVRPLPSRGPFRPTISLPVVSQPFTHADTRQDMDLAEEDPSEQFRHIDFSAYAANPDGF